MRDYVEEPEDDEDLPQHIPAPADPYDSPALLRLSHSSLNLYRTCPRRFFLSRIGLSGLRPDSEETGITFSFGGIVGDGIQQLMIGRPLDRVILDAALAWPFGYDVRDKSRKKSVWEAIEALERFHADVLPLFQKEFGVLTYDARPAIELGFRIDLDSVYPGGYYVGYLDAALETLKKAELVVMEGKTSSSTLPHEATYRNSFQALGYSVVLDALTPGKTNYLVIYPVYSTSSKVWEIFRFRESLSRRADWLVQLAFEASTIQRYKEARFFPKNGQACYSYGSPCPFYGICDLDPAKMPRTGTPSGGRSDPIVVSKSLEDLLQSQTSAATLNPPQEPELDINDRTL